MQSFTGNVKIFIKRFQQIQFSTIVYQDIPSWCSSTNFGCNRHVNTIRRQMFVLSSLSLIVFVFLSYNFLTTPSDIPIAFVSQPGNTNQTRISRITREPIIFSKSEYLKQKHKPSENVICYLVASYMGDPRFAFNPYPRLRERVLQLDERFDDGHVTDVIIFHTGYPFRADLLPIMDGSRRHVEFVNIDHIFYRVSPGFQPHFTNPTWTMKGKWNYHQMCYFWFKQVFELKVIQKYRYMMRLDDDSQLEGKWPNIFDIMSKQGALYLANFRTVDFNYILPGITKIQTLTANYISQHHIIARNPAMLADVFNHTLEIPNYWNNIEAIDLSFIRGEEVLNFTKAIDESQGIFLYRWGDAPLRYVTLALFANASQILHREKLGYAHCHPC